MSKLKYGLLILLMAAFCVQVNSQQISKDDLIALTPLWKGERFADGRPKVPDNITRQRMKLVTLEEAWAVMRNERFNYQYADGWK